MMSFLRNRDRRRLRRSRALLTAVAAFSGATFARALVPLVLTRVLNRLLKKSSPYAGTIDDARIDFWKGRLVVTGVNLSTFAADQPVPAADVRQVAVQLDWKKLFRGQVVASAEIDAPKVLLRASTAPTGKPMPETLPEDRPELAEKPDPDKLPKPEPGERWNRKVLKMPPLRIDHIVIRNGELHVKGIPGQNGTDVRVDALNVRVSNITNSIKTSGSMTATMHADARVMGAGRLTIDGFGYPMDDEPSFEVDMALDRLDLSELSPIIRSQMATDLRSGELTVKAEAAAAGGRIHGYVKPAIRNLDAVKSEGDGAVTGALLRSVAKILQNKSTEQIATRVPFEGELADPAIGKMAAAKNILRNAFSKPLSTELEHSPKATIASVTAEAVEAEEKKAKAPTKLQSLFAVVKESVSRWSADSAPRMGASLAYYTVFSIAPLLLLAISIAGLVLGREAVQGKIVDQLGGLVGQQGAEMIQSMIQAAGQSRTSGGVASAISIIALLLGASAMMAELKFALNKIWRVKARAGIAAAIKDKFLSVGMVLVVGFLLLVSLAASSALAALGKYLGGVLPVPEALLHVMDLVLSLGVFILVFAAMYKALPDAKVKWGDVWTGAITTAVLFVLGKFALGAYLGKGAVGSSYGAAGSLLVVLLWIYYSAQILYLGAEFTKVYSDRLGSGVKPSNADLPEKLAY